jgi:hypothetical protein
MKKTAIALCIFLLSGTTQKEYKIKDATAAKVSVALATVYKYLDESNLPNQDVRKLQGILASADSSLRADIRDSTINKK